MIQSLLKPSSQQWMIAVVASLACLSGCSSRVEHPSVFEPNLVHAMKYQIRNDDLPMEQASEDATWVVTKMFGTPDEPKLPEVVTADEELASIVSTERLMRASGPDVEGRGLYGKLCVVCHGVTGNGRGPTAAVQTPYPRDYRMGIFKFKSTPRGVKPTRDDLATSIRNGINGTAMKGVKDLAKDVGIEVSDEDVEALVDYVIYLSWRGEHERLQIDMGILEGILEGGERLINSDFGRRLDRSSLLRKELEKIGEMDESELDDKQKETLALYERFQEDWGYAEEYAVEIGESWLEAEGEVLDVPDPPTGLPLAESYQDVVKFRSGDQAEAINASIKRGQELFVGKVASCSKCHGEKGLGDGQTTDYDDWTKDWTERMNIKPDDRETLIPLLARGALSPRNAIPRNFAEGVFRGGSSSKDLYRRIVQGIDGTPMPAATFVEGQFEQEDVWHLINFIRSLQTAETSASSEPAPAT